jgi:hypothetical protein
MHSENGKRLWTATTGSGRRNCCNAKAKALIRFTNTATAKAVGRNGGGTGFSIVANRFSIFEDSFLSATQDKRLIVPPPYRRPSTKADAGLCSSSGRPSRVSMLPGSVRSSLDHGQGNSRARTVDRSLLQRRIHEGWTQERMQGRIGGERSGEIGFARTAYPARLVPLTSRNLRGHTKQRRTSVRLEKKFRRIFADRPLGTAASDKEQEITAKEGVEFTLGACQNTAAKWNVMKPNELRYGVVLVL